MTMPSPERNRPFAALAARRAGARASRLAGRQSRRIERVLDEERRHGARMALAARIAALGIIAVWLVISQWRFAVVYYLALLALFLVAGIANGALAGRRKYRPWHKYAFVTFDAVLLTIALLLPNPLAETQYPIALLLTGTSYLYFFLFLALTSLSLSPWFVLWAGATSALSWALGAAWVISQPEIVLVWRGTLAIDAESRSVNVVAAVDTVEQIILILVTSGVLALTVGRAQRLVRRQASAERERGNLARYFSPNVVDGLAAMDDPLGGIRRQDVAILFADIVGFTAFAETATPEDVVGLLRSHYEALSDCVFAHGGTVDKYIGDALMATFGTPATGPDDATRALRCAREMLAIVARRNAARAASGRMPLQIGIGLHYGTVVLGNVGGERRLEFTVIGDAVNVASRLETMTRTLGCALVVSDDLATAVRRESGAEAPELRGMHAGPAIALRGRSEAVGIQIWRQIEDRWGRPDDGPDPSGLRA